MTMESIANLINKISINNLDVGSEHWVDITHINNPHSFYVRPTMYRAYLSVLHFYEGPLTPKEFRLGSIVIYKSKLLRCYVRGRIMFIQNENILSCDLFAPDYGCFEQNIPFENLRKPYHTNSTDVPPLAVHCQLADCKPRNDSWSKEIVESMKYFIGKERAKMIIRGKSPDTFSVELYNSCPDDIATMLAFEGSTTLGYGDNMLSRLAVTEPERHYYRFTEYNVGETLAVRVQAGDSLRSFYVADLENYKHYLNERDNFTYFCKKQKEMQPEQVRVGMAVGVLMISLNKFERAVVTEINKDDEKAQVMLVDWGKTMQVPLSRLKPMLSKFFHLPAVAIHCAAEESQAWDNGLHKFLYPGFKFNITILEVGEQFEQPHIVSISSVGT